MMRGVRAWGHSTCSRVRLSAPETPAREETGVVRTFAVSLLSGFIAGVAVAAVVAWFLRDRIKAWMIRRRAKR